MADNPELIAAKASGVPCLERSDMLGLLTRRYSKAVCVAGTHGKTTTTSMLTMIMLAANVDPSAVIGGIFTGFLTMLLLKKLPRKFIENIRLS